MPKALPFLHEQACLPIMQKQVRIHSEWSIQLSTSRIIMAIESIDNLISIDSTYCKCQIMCIGQTIRIFLLSVRKTPDLGRGEMLNPSLNLLSGVCKGNISTRFPARTPT